MLREWAKIVCTLLGCLSYQFIVVNVADYCQKRFSVLEFVRDDSPYQNLFEVVGDVPTFGLKRGRADHKGPSRAPPFWSAPLAFLQGQI